MTKFIEVNHFIEDGMTPYPGRPAHTKLLASGVLIVEHLCDLSDLPRSGFKFYAVPLRIVRGASFPVRAFAEILE